MIAGPRGGRSPLAPWAGLLVAISACAGTAGEAAPRPNVLFILTEDQGAHLGALGTPGLETPHMDRLARGGVLFRQAFVDNPVCSASKAAIYTGLHAHTSGIRENTVNFFVPADGLTAQQRAHRLYRIARIRAACPTLVELLHGAGYHTGVTHKLHVTPNEKFPFDEWIRQPSREAARDFMRRARSRGKPWFLMYNIRHPHRPFRSSETTAIGVDPGEVDPPGSLPDSPVVRRDWAEYLDAIQLADSGVGEAVAALRESGEEERTLVIFMGDHGPGFQRAKRSPYDLGLRVPLVVSGPGVRRGVVRDEVVGSIDLMPTILDWLSIERPELEHGRSLRPLLTGERGARWRDVLVCEVHHHCRRPPEIGMQERSVYDGRHRLIWREHPELPRDVNADLRDRKPWGNRTYAETRARRREQPLPWRLLGEIDNGRLGGSPPRVELYDTREDPDEIRDLASDPAHRETLRRLLGALREWAERTGDGSIRVPETWPPEPSPSEPSSSEPSPAAPRE